MFEIRHSNKKRQTSFQKNLFQEKLTLELLNTKSMLNHVKKNVSFLERLIYL